MTVEIRLNGQLVRDDVEPQHLLLDYLREDRGLTGPDEFAWLARVDADPGGARSGVTSECRLKYRSWSTSNTNVRSVRTRRLNPRSMHKARTSSSPNHCDISLASADPPPAMLPACCGGSRSPSPSHNRKEH